MTTNKENAFWAAALVDPKVFLHLCFSRIHSDKPFLDNYHIDAIFAALLDTYEGRTQRLIINMPPRYFKSFIVSVVWPAYVLGLDPAARIICASYSDEVSKVLTRDFRAIVESDWYRRLFSNVKGKISNSGEFVTDRGGGRVAISVHGSLTGRGGDYIIVDDPIKPDDARSDKLRDSNNQWFKTTLLSRLDDKTRGVLILVMQRLHVNDLTGFIENDGYRKLSLPAIAMRDETVPMGQGRKPYLRRAGEVLHEKREDRKVLDRMRSEMGSLTFAAQYQQAPESPEGEHFKRRYFQVVDKPPKMLRHGIRWLSVDLAISESETADFTAITRGYSDSTGHYLLKTERSHWDLERVLGRLLAEHRGDPEIRLFLEYNNAGESLRRALVARGIRVFGHHAKESKVVRAYKVMHVFEEKRVFLVRLMDRDDEWIDPLIAEFMLFPRGRNDDQVDSVVQAIRAYDHQSRQIRAEDDYY